MGEGLASADQLTVIDLFCGAGGLSGGLERAGLVSVAALDQDADCIATLQATQTASVRLPNSKRRYLEDTRILRADIREIAATDLRPAHATSHWRPDVLAGGPPCQPFSSAGAGLALNDPRGQLFEQFVQLAADLTPRIVLFENVAGLVTAKGWDGQPGGVLRLIQSRFEEVGYACRFALLNAADFGAAQRRVRLYMIATRNEALPEFPIATHAAEKGHGLRPWVSLRQSLSRMPEAAAEDIIRPSGKRAGELELLQPGEGLKSHGIVEANRPSGHWGYRQDCFLADPALPSRTIRAASTPDWVRTPEGLRRLTWRECAMLQGFDRGWEFAGGRASRYRQIGNAVQGDIGEVLGRTIVSALRRNEVGSPSSAPWPAAFDRRVRYTAMEERVNGDHRRAARANKQRPAEILCAAE